MISQISTVSYYDSTLESKSATQTYEKSKRMCDATLINAENDERNRCRNFAVQQSSYLKVPKTNIMNFDKPSSLPNGFLTDFSNRQSSFLEASSSDSYDSSESNEDTESDLSSDEDELENEIKSRNEADDELASLLGSDESCASEPCRRMGPILERPNNPIVQDRRFQMARCSAPSLEEQQRPCSVYVSRPSYCALNSRHF